LEIFFDIVNIERNTSKMISFSYVVWVTVNSKLSATFHLFFLKKLQSPV